MCPNSCTFPHGVCDGSSGRCQCEPGFGGVDCATRTSRLMNLLLKSLALLSLTSGTAQIVFLNDSAWHFFSLNVTEATHLQFLVYDWYDMQAYILCDRSWNASSQAVAPVSVFARQGELPNHAQYDNGIVTHGTASTGITFEVR